jgi:hypothetical protein
LAIASYSLTVIGALLMGLPPSLGVVDRFYWRSTRA